MTDSTHAEARLAPLARVRDEELAGLESGTAARTLLAVLVADEVAAHQPAAHQPAAHQPAARQSAPGRWSGRRPARRLALMAGVAAAMTAAAVVGPSLVEDGSGNATSYANSAIEVNREGKFYVARIKDPLADHALYVEAFRAVGKDVDIELVPVAPNRVGQLLESGSGGRGRFGSVEVRTELVSSGPEPVDCSHKPTSCTIVIRVSADTNGSIWYKLGRAAQPGEAYHEPVLPQGATPPHGGGSAGGN